MSEMFANRKLLIFIVTCIFALIECVYLFYVFSKKPVEVSVLEAMEKLPGDNITDFVPPFIPLINDYVIASGYNLLGCSVRKSMSQLNINLLCYLNNTKLFVERNQSLSDVWYDNRSSCSNISSYDTEHPEGSLSLDQFIKFAFVRNPEERFVSFFVDKCLKWNSCYNCTDVRCASKLIYEKLMFMASNESMITKDEEKFWFEWHVAPQTWNCDFHKSLKDFHLIQIGTSLEDRRLAMEKLQRVLEFAGVEHVHIAKIKRDMVGSETKHATHGSKQTLEVLEQVRNDPYVLHYLHRIYYFDYVAFGFEVPEFFSFQDFENEIANKTMRL